MAMTPSIEWFELEPEPALVGSRCTSCGTTSFPPEARGCRNPACSGTEFERHRFATTGKVWSYTDARYQPPPPYVPLSDPFEPFGLVAVELDGESIIVLGQLARDVSLDSLRVGDRVRLTSQLLDRDESGDLAIWAFRPEAAA